MKATLRLPKVKLTEPELLWLCEAYELYKSGKEVNIRALRVRLREQLPVDFEPEKIDGRVLLHGRVITLYGIWHVDPSTSLLNEAGAVIEAFRKLIFEDPDRESIAAEEVANVTELPQPRVEMLINQIRLLGFFWSEVEKASDDGYSEVKVKDSRVLQEYLHYEGIEQLIKRLSQNDEYAKDEEASAKASQTLILNDGTPDFGQGKQTISPKSSIDIFISHSSQDVKLAKELAEFLNIIFKTDKIRCTSVPGYKLEPGATVEETLRREIHESKVFIGLITPTSLTSHYVLFELGARWGAQLDLIPVLASGADPHDLREPLKNRNPVRCDVRAEIRDLINKIAIVLEAEPYYVAVHEKLVDALIKKAKVGKDRKHKQQGAESKLEENSRTEPTSTVTKLEENLNLIQEALDFVDQLTEKDLTSTDGRIVATETFRERGTHSFVVRDALRSYFVSGKDLATLKKIIRELLEDERRAMKTAIGVNLLGYMSITTPGHPLTRFNSDIDRIFKEIDVQLGTVCRNLSIRFPGRRFGDDQHYSSEFWSREDFAQAKNILNATKSA